MLFYRQNQCILGRDKLWKVAFVAQKLGDKLEPPHIHVKRDRQIAKFWLNPISLAKNRGFPEHELNRIERLVAKHRTFLFEEWHDYFGS